MSTSPSMPTAACPVPPSCQPCSGIHAHAVKTWSKNAQGRAGGKLFQPGGCGEKLSWGVHTKLGSGWRRGRNVGSSRTIQHQHNSVKRQKAPRKALWTMAHKRPLVLRGGFLGISSFHAHPWLWALLCTAPGAPSRPSPCTQHVKLDASPGLAGCSSGQPRGTQCLAGMWLWGCFRGTKVAAAADSTPAAVMGQSQGVLQVPNSSFLLLCRGRGICVTNQ